MILRHSFASNRRTGAVCFVVGCLTLGSFTEVLRQQAPGRETGCLGDLAGSSGEGTIADTETQHNAVDLDIH